MRLEFKNAQPKLMGILNLSPHSFYKPCKNLDDAIALAAQMVSEGVDIIDVGAEATNPSLATIKDSSAQVEIEKLLPVIEAIRQRFDVLISVDTSQAEVMRALIAAGATLINDQRALQLPGALAAVVESKVSVCLMHGFVPRREAGSSTPETLLETIKRDWRSMLDRYQAAGLEKDKIILDPGFGGGHYGKNTAENFYLLKHLDELVALGYPLLVGWSRKSMLGEVLGAPAEDRLYGSIAAAILATLKGAALIRTHDVAATRDALRIIERYNAA